MLRAFLQVSLKLRGLLDAAVALTCVCTVASFFGRLWWPLELGCHFRVQCLLLLLNAEMHIKR